MENAVRPLLTCKHIAEEIVFVPARTFIIVGNIQAEQQSGPHESLCRYPVERQRQIVTRSVIVIFQKVIKLCAAIDIRVRLLRPRLQCECRNAFLDEGKLI